LDAEYFQPKYEKILEKVKQYKGAWGYLHDLVSIRDTNFYPQPRTRYRYIELSNISNFGEVTGCTEARGAELPSRARRRVKTGDVIVSSIEGSLSSSALITEEYNNALCSTGFYVINSNVFNAATLLCLMKSHIGLQQLERGCSGTILTAINKSEFMNLALPKDSSAVKCG
jgi:type I restriction enzyme S subunit